MAEQWSIRRDLAVEVIATVLLGVAAFGLALILKLPQPLIVTIVAALCLITFWSTRRHRAISRLRRVFVTQTSASLACDAALRLIERQASRSSISTALDLANRLAAARPFPLASVVGPTLERAQQREFPDARAFARAIKTLRSERERSTYLLTVEVAELVRQLPQGSVLLIHGFSGAVTEALRLAAHEIDASVIVIRDTQYPLRSLREDRIVRKRLGGAVTVYSANLAAVKELLDTGRTSLTPVARARPIAPRSYVHSIRWWFRASGHVQLSAAAPVLALLGCESVLPKGSVAIPADGHLLDVGTPAFLQMLNEARARTTGCPIRTVFVAESFKFQSSQGDGQLRTAAPRRATLVKRALGYVGYTFAIPEPDVLLFLVPPSDWDAIVTESSIIAASMVDELVTTSREWSSRSSGTFASPELTRILPPTIHVAYIDLDGVLVDDESAHFLAFAILTRRSSGHRLTIMEYFNACHGRTDHEGVETLKRDGLLMGATADLAHRKQRLTSLSFRQIVGASDLVRELHRRGVRLVLVTASSIDRADDRLSRLGVESLFGRVLSNLSGHQRIAGIEQDLLEAGMAPKDALVIDDNASNLHAASRRGVTTIGVESIAPLRPRDAAFIVSDCAAIIPLLGSKILTG